MEPSRGRWKSWLSTALYAPGRDRRAACPSPLFRRKGNLAARVRTFLFPPRSLQLPGSTGSMTSYIAKKVGRKVFANQLADQEPIDPHYEVSETQRALERRALLRERGWSWPLRGVQSSVVRSKARGAREQGQEQGRRRSRR